MVGYPICPGSLRGEVRVGFSLFSPLSRVLGDPILGEEMVSLVWVHSM